MNIYKYISKPGPSSTVRGRLSCLAGTGFFLNFPHKYYLTLRVRVIERIGMAVSVFVVPYAGGR
jgi:hypothetical protein